VCSSDLGVISLISAFSRQAIVSISNFSAVV
jgi:hypothetical protein